jgi:hypothetical protein
MRQQAVNDLEQLCLKNDDGSLNCSQSSDPEAARDADKRKSTFDLLMWTSWGVAGVGFGTAVVLYLLDKPDSSQAGTRLIPAAPRAEAGLSVVTTF